MDDSTKSPIHAHAPALALALAHAHAEESGNTQRGAKIDAVDLCYSTIKMQGILKNVSFGLDSGDMCALMGPSGAGKR